MGGVTKTDLAFLPLSGIALARVRSAGAVEIGWVPSRCRSGSLYLCQARLSLNAAFNLVGFD